MCSWGRLWNRVLSEGLGKNSHRIYASLYPGQNWEWGEADLRCGCTWDNSIAYRLVAGRLLWKSTIAFGVLINRGGETQAFVSTHEPTIGWQPPTIGLVVNPRISSSWMLRNSLGDETDSSHASWERVNALKRECGVRTPLQNTTCFLR